MATDLSLSARAMRERTQLHDAFALVQLDVAVGNPGVPHSAVGTSILVELTFHRYVFQLLRVVVDMDIQTSQVDIIDLLSREKVRHDLEFSVAGCRSKPRAPGGAPQREAECSPRVIDASAKFQRPQVVDARVVAPKAPHGSKDKKQSRRQG